MKLRAPRTPRECFQLLSLFDPGRGLDALLDRLDWSGANPRQLYSSILGRLPETAATAVAGEGYVPREQASALLLSDEYLRKVFRLGLEAFPEKRRLLFAHIPKCAGTDLIGHLSPRYAWLDENLGREDPPPAKVLFGHLMEFALRAEQAEMIFMSGHVGLNWYLSKELYRYGDRLITTIRHPHDIAVSMANYVLKRFAEDPECKNSGPKGWAKTLEMESFDPTIPPEALRELGHRIVAEPRIVVPNRLCTFLGSGTADSAIEMMARCDIELTETSRYNSWLKNAWGIGKATRSNASPAVISWADLPEQTRATFSEACREDIKLYEHIVGRMEKKGEDSIFGPELI